jgi:hypothetical protein
LRFTLFVPAAFDAAEAREVRLTVHFHTVAWFAIAEHLRRGLDGPLAVFALGEGSSVYRTPFEDRARFGRVLKRVEAELRRGGAGEGCRIAGVDVSSFSAGYGAVRELVKSPEYVALIRRIVLCDSLYASFAPGRTDQAAAEHIDPWLPFCRAAARGEKSFCLTFSEVPTATYANTAQCARALAEGVGVSLAPVAEGSLPATLDPRFPLRRRADRGQFHLWGYGGTDGPAHLTHVRHLADVWRALDEAEAGAAVGARGEP